MSQDGEIGRHSGLKIRRFGNGLAGSSPAPGTIDETFQRLKRIPISEAIERWVAFGKVPITGGDIDRFFEDIGWNEDEFYREREIAVLFQR